MNLYSPNQRDALSRAFAARLRARANPEPCNSMFEDLHTLHGQSFLQNVGLLLDGSCGQGEQLLALEILETGGDEWREDLLRLISWACYRTLPSFGPAVWALLLPGSRGPWRCHLRALIQARVLDPEHPLTKAP